MPRNVLLPGDLREALSPTPVRSLGRGSGAVLVLPEWTARLALLEVEGNDVKDYARFRLASSLPYPLAEAVVDVLRVGPGRALAAAVRRSIVEEYETAAAGAGFVSERVDLAPLVGLAGLLDRDPSPTVHALLGETASPSPHSIAAVSSPTGNAGAIPSPARASASSRKRRARPGSWATGASSA